MLVVQQDKKTYVQVQVSYSRSVSNDEQAHGTSVTTTFLFPCSDILAGLCQCDGRVKVNELLSICQSSGLDSEKCRRHLNHLTIKKPGFCFVPEHIESDLQRARFNRSFAIGNSWHLYAGSNGQEWCLPRITRVSLVGIRQNIILFRKELRSSVLLPNLVPSCDFQGVSLC